jgi:hypothetical protein
MVFRRQRMEGPKRRAVNDQPDVGLAWSTDAVDMILEVAEHEEDTIGIRKMIDDALPRRRLGRCRLPQANRADKTGQAGAKHGSTLHGSS